MAAAAAVGCQRDDFGVKTATVLADTGGGKVGRADDDVAVRRQSKGDGKRLLVLKLEESRGRGRESLVAV